MPGIVKCDVCGQICNASRLNSHKRLAHRKHATTARTGSQNIRAILALYARLSDAERKLVRDSLAEAGAQPLALQ